MQKAKQFNHTFAELRKIPLSASIVLQESGLSSQWNGYQSLIPKLHTARAHV